MLLFNQDIFDEFITGTTTTWYTAASFNNLIGSADRLLFLAYPTGLVSAPTLTVYVESSSDDQHWYSNSQIWDASALSDGVVIKATTSDLLAFNRLKITLGGSASTTQCRLKLSVTGRVF